MKTQTSTASPFVMSASTMIGDAVRNPAGEDLGEIVEIMLDVRHGRIAYAVLSFGGFLGLGDKLFAMPWDMLTLDTENECFVLDIRREQLEKARGFDKEDWPDFADDSFHSRTFDYWGQNPYWAR